MIELEFKRKVSAAMEVRGAVVQWHEDKYELNIADLSYSFKGIDGWIEFKKQRKMTSIANLVGRNGSMTAGQLDWLTKRGETGSGHCWLAIGFGSGQNSCLVHWSQIQTLNKQRWVDHPHMVFGSPEAMASYFTGLAREYSSRYSLPFSWRPY